MDPEIRAQWCAALRSGEYKQGNGYLRQNNGGFCCLGVLCDLAVKAAVIPAATNPAGLWMFDDREFSFLPPTVVQWAGLNAIDPIVRTIGGQAALSNLNDSSATFATIADLIDGGAS
jgi:hypothetical protein